MIEYDGKEDMDGFFKFFGPLKKVPDPQVLDRTVYLVRPSETDDWIPIFPVSYSYSEEKYTMGCLKKMVHASDNVLNSAVWESVDWQTVNNVRSMSYFE